MDEITPDCISLEDLVIEDIALESIELEYCSLDEIALDCISLEDPMLDEAALLECTSLDGLREEEIWYGQVATEQPQPSLEDLQA